MNCRYGCDNEARYIDEFGMLVCGTCPIKDHVDSIRISDVGALLKLAREIDRHATSGDGQVTLFAPFTTQLRALIGRKP